jgi:signal transduction histidine kinase
MMPGEAGRVERVLAVARAFLAVASLIAIWIDATEPSRYASLAYGLMSAYAVYSLIVLVLVTRARKFPLRFLLTLHGIDLLWPAVMTAFTIPASSPFFIFDAFVLLEAAYRWGLTETLVTGALEALFYVLTSAVATFGPSPFRVLIPGEPDVNRMIMRPLYLVIMAYLLGYLGEQEKMQRAEASCIARLIGKVQAEIGLRGAMREVFEGAMEVFGSRQTLLILRDKNSDRVFLWNGARESPDSHLSLNWKEADAAGRAEFSADPPGSAWIMRRTPRGNGQDDYSVEILGETGAAFSKIRWSPPAALRAASSFHSALGVAMDPGAEWAAQWWILDPDCGPRPRGAARFLRTMARQLFPSVHGVFVLRRLRLQAGAVERARVARELHDGVIQALIGLEMQMDVLRRRPGAAAENLSGEIARIQSLLHTEILNVRELMQQMKPVEFSPKQFLDLLAQMVDKFRRDTGIVARFVSSLEEAEVNSQVGSEVARILQEALVNVRRHSGARNVLVRFDARDGMWTLAIDDDGCGYDFSGRLSQAQLDRARKGPVVIKERARSIGGEVTIESVPGHGSKLEIRVPQRKYGQ